MISAVSFFSFSALPFSSHDRLSGPRASRTRNGMIIPRLCPAGDVDTLAGFLSLFPMNPRFPAGYMKH